MDVLGYSPDECPNCAGLVVATLVEGEVHETCTRDCGWWRRADEPVR